jgi:hypothetical protein
MSSRRRQGGSCKYENTRRKNKDEPKQRSSFMSRCLGDDAEVGIGEPIGADTLEEPPERRGVGHIGRLCLTTPTSKHATNTATNVSDNRARISGFRKDVRFAVVVDYPPLHRGVVDGHVVDVVLANDGEDASRAANGGVSGIATLDDQQAQFAICVPHIRGVH